MATIDFLPPESLIRVLELASEYSQGNPNEHAAGVRTLVAASLVARAWKEPAQALMWRRLSIWDRRQIERLEKSPVRGKYRSEELWLWACRLGPAQTVEGFLSGLRGITSLELYDNTGTKFDVGWLALPSLRELKTLSIRAHFTDRVPANLRPSFRLRTLTLGGYATSTALNHALLASSVASLLTLTLELIPPTIPPTLLASLPLIASSLSSLTIRGTIPGLSLSSFTTLTSLTLHIYATSEFAEYDNLLASLHPPLPSLRLSPPFMSALEARISRKEWEGLKQVGTDRTPRWVSWFGTDAGEAFLALCLERGMEVVELLE